MGNKTLDEVVERLLVDRRFLSRFRRSPRRALRRYDLSEREIRAVKSGDAHELLRRGLDPRLIAPVPAPNPAVVQGWLLGNARRLVPAALFAAATLALGTAQAVPPGGRRVRSNVKLKKVKQTGDGLSVKGIVRSKKDACERKRDVGVFGRVRRVDQSIDDFFLGEDRTNRKGKFAVGDDIGLPPNSRVIVQALVEPADRGNKVCRDDLSPEKELETS